MEGLRKEEMVEKRDDESRSEVCFYITKKNYCRKPVEQFLKAVDELQLKDITEFTSKIISKPLKMGCFGEHLSLFLNTFNILFFTYRVLSVPIYDTVSSKFC
ncbi:hypothetical protein F2Q70_00013767 [Brassica cretica]|uniref:Uncharacterized protein n=1 Tax=Brassica cretica TaxID=69181 RepID=A0A8S9M9S9_BRACR|nr:hypothetical protein F2Q70_00013767 [Brassica cretica]